MGTEALLNIRERERERVSNENGIYLILSFELEWGTEEWSPTLTVSVGGNGGDGVSNFVCFCFKFVGFQWLILNWVGFFLYRVYSQRRT